MMATPEQEEQKVYNRIVDVYARSRWSPFTGNIEKSLDDLKDKEGLNLYGSYPNVRPLKEWAFKVLRRATRPLLNRQIEFNVSTRQVLTQLHSAVTVLEHDLRVLNHKSVKFFPDLSESGKSYTNHSKPRIAYFSPLRPVESGIADYSENLLPYLRKHLDIDLFHDVTYQPDADIEGGLFTRHTFPADRFEDLASRNEYAAIVYHFGNNPCHTHMYPQLMRYAGITVLHDYHLSSLLNHISTRSQELGLTMLGENTHHYGEARAAEIDLLIKNNQITGHGMVEQKLHMNRRIFTRSLGVIVHSQWAYEEAVRDFSEDCDNIAYIPLLTYPVKSDPMNGCDIRQELGIAQDCFLVCAFGYVAPAKRPLSILKAFQKFLRDNRSAHLVFAGATEPELVTPLQDAVGELGLEDRVHFTGFLDMTDFCRYIQATDVCLNLRYPFYGETSAALVQHLSYGKPVIVTDIGSFSEFPDEVVLKIPRPDACDEVAELYKALVALSGDADRRAAMGEAAMRYVAKVHSPERCAALYRQFIAQVLSSPSAKRKMLADYVGREAVVNEPRDPDLFFEQLSEVICRQDYQAAMNFIPNRMGASS